MGKVNRRQHGEGSIYQRKRDSRWVAVADLGVRGGRRDRREFTSDDMQTAIAKRQAFLDRRRDGFTMPRGRQPYVSEWMLHWLHNVAKRKVGPTTWHGSYRQKVTELICPYFDRVFLHELCEEDIEDWHRQLESAISKRTGRPLSASTIGQAHRIMSTGIKAAVVRGRIQRNPLSNVTPPHAERTPPEPPTPAEVDAILSACADWPNGCRWVVALRTGIRQGEALALRWRDVRLDGEPQVTISQSAARVAGERIVKAPKSAKSRRTIPLPASAVVALKAHKAGQRVTSLDGLVFTDPQGRPVHPRADYQDWHDLLESAGLRMYRVHDCRHAVATQLLEQGVDPRVVQDLMGWSTLSMTEIYQHVRPALMAAAMDVLDGTQPPRR